MLIAIAIAILAFGGLALAVLIAWASGARGQRREARAEPGARLRISDGDRRAWSAAMRPDQVVTIGRERDNLVAIDDPLVSRRHARLLFDGGWLVEDLQSANGTFVNGHRVARCPLRPGDALQIGGTRLELALQAAAADARPRASDGSALTRARTTAQPALGPFTVIGTLGEGGISRVLLAEDARASGRLVALKLLHRPSGYLLGKFQQEGALRLDHPHITRVYETGEIGGRAYIALEYVEGVSLRRLLNGKSWPINVALLVIGQVLMALEYAHADQIIHRDVKPENIMISPAHGVKLIDFGIAKDLAAAGQTQHMLIGTPQYMSYEQAVGRPVNPTSDLYSTAIVLYEMLAGIVPFNAPQSYEVIWQHQGALPLPPSQINSAIPPRVEAAILRALEKDAVRRFQSAAELAAALGCPRRHGLPPAFSAEIVRLMAADHTHGAYA